MSSGQLASSYVFSPYPSGCGGAYALAYLSRRDYSCLTSQDNFLGSMHVQQEKHGSRAVERRDRQDQYEVKSGFSLGALDVMNFGSIQLPTNQRVPDSHRCGARKEICSALLFITPTAR
jgi:hypothetical protein